MKFVEPPSADAARRGHPADDLDGLLAAFFKREMPDPWPRLESSDEQPTIALNPKPARKWSPLPRGRFALAASVALLLGGGLLLSGKFQEIISPPSMSPTGDNSANRKFREPLPRIINEGPTLLPDGKTGWRIDVAPGTPASKDVKNQLNDQLP